LAVNVVDWLCAIDAHTGTIDADLIVATAISNGSTDVEGFSEPSIANCVDELVALGFLESVVKIDCPDHDDCAEVLLELRMPSYQPKLFDICVGRQDDALAFFFRGQRIGAVAAMSVPLTVA
jgi:hypothetical protein